MSNYLTNEQIKLLICDNGLVEAREGYPPAMWSMEDTVPHQGFLLYTVVHEHPAHKPYVELRQIYVKSSERQKGVGRKLVAELVKITKQEGINRIVVVSQPGDENPFKPFLLELGFKPISPVVEATFNYEKIIR